MLSKGREVIERLADAHPRIKRDLVRHVCEPALHRNFVFFRIETEYAHLPALRTEQIEQTLHRGGLACAVAAEESVTAAGLNRQVEVMDRLRALVGVAYVLEFDGWNWRAHGW